MEKNIEVEVRGPLSESQFNDFKSLLEKEGEFVKKKERILVDFSTLSEEDIRNRTLDVRARITNGVPEIIIKKGLWGATDQREETAVQGVEGEFSNMIKALALLGHKRGVVCVRDILVYNYKDVEFALVIVPDHSYFFEAEIMATEDTKDEALDKLKELCSNLNLELFTNESFFDYIDLLNEEASDFFDYDKDGENYFREKYNI